MKTVERRGIKYWVNEPAYKTERDLQIAIVDELKTMPELVSFSVPNEATHMRYNYYAATGVLRGASDLVVVTDSTVFFVEVKNGTNYSQSTEQKVFQNRLEETGNKAVKYVLVRSLYEFDTEVLMDDYDYSDL